jgi:dolichyl-phosphate beta-glucosyltransferase
MAPTPTTVVVIPCFDEADRLDVDGFLAFVHGWPQGRLLFVDDGSHDGTRAVLEMMVAREPRGCALLPLAHNQGKAEAVRQGMLSAFALEPDSVGYWDADLATPLDTILAFERILAERPTCDLVMGARVRLLGRSITRHPARHYLGRVFATAASLLLALPVYDTQCGAKLFRAGPATRALFHAPFRSRWLFDVELLLRLATDARRTGVDPETKICELPLETWRDVGGSKLRTMDITRALIDLGCLLGESWRGPRGAVPAERDEVERGPSRSGP